MFISTERQVHDRSTPQPGYIEKPHTGGLQVKTTTCEIDLIFAVTIEPSRLRSSFVLATKSMISAVSKDEEPKGKPIAN